MCLGRKVGVWMVCVFSTEKKGESQLMTERILWTVKDMDKPYLLHPHSVDQGFIVMFVYRKK